MTPETLGILLAARAARRPVALLTRLPDGAQILYPDQPAPPALAEAAEAALRDDRAGPVSLGAENWFIQPQAPPPRLIIIGAVHVAQALVPMAAAVGLAVTVVDPRRAFATEERFAADATLVDEWPDDALKALRPESRTAIVTLTHDPKLDDPALDVALRSEAFYIGALGSRRTHAKRVDRLTAAGHGPEAIARIHAPVGLDIGAVTAPEIALSVIAQVVAARRGKL
ncbi:XdhC family protein [Roseomonas sp. SSH11]|uniref:XdhC family protein n=1 Tax=Pararoseomonas baculiformis TaxID=2820812 RepID=A0ABS4AAB4_9PROT|nr:XdhC family protein [Pararoseomonas baculiformis]